MIKIGDLVKYIGTKEQYAAYANHCAIQKKVPMSWPSWKRSGMPKAPDGGPSAGNLLRKGE